MLELNFRLHYLLIGFAFAHVALIVNLLVTANDPLERRTWRHSELHHLLLQQEYYLAVVWNLIIFVGVGLTEHGLQGSSSAHPLSCGSLLKIAYFMNSRSLIPDVVQPCVEENKDVDALNNIISPTAAMIREGVLTGKPFVLTYRG